MNFYLQKGLCLGYLLLFGLLVACSAVPTGGGGGGSGNSSSTGPEIFGIYSDTHPTTLKFPPDAASNVCYLTWNTGGADPATNEISSGNTSGDGSNYMTVDFSANASGSGVSYSTMPEYPGADMSRFITGSLVFSLNIPAGQPAVTVSIEKEVYSTNGIDVTSHRSSSITLVDGTYGYTNDGTWHIVNIPIMDFLAQTDGGMHSKLIASDLINITAYFQLRSSNNQIITGLQYDNVYWTADSYPIPAGKSLVWSDEFNGPNIDTTKWGYDTFSNHTVNNELQDYTSLPANSYISNGMLVIKAIKTGANSYTSARLLTQNKFSFTYGTVVAKLKLPYGQGMWPAFWMLGQNISTVNWPYCGEIDIMEMIGGSGADNQTTYGTLHWYAGGNQSYGTSYVNAAALSEDWHYYEADWTSTGLTMKFDGNIYYSVTFTPAMSAFNQPFFILLNLAVGGNWPGSPNGTTVFPQYYYIDWVRVYQ